MEQKIHPPESQFSKSFRGYSVSEVGEYVAQVNYFADQSNQIQARLEEKIQNLEIEIARLREVENSLFRALKMAEEAQQNWLNKIDSEVNQLIETAQEKAVNLIGEAESESLKIKMLAENQAKLMIENAQQEVVQQNRTLIELKAAQKEVATQLMQVSELTLEKVKSWSSPADLVGNLNSEITLEDQKVVNLISKGSRIVKKKTGSISNKNTSPEKKVAKSPVKSKSNSNSSSNSNSNSNSKSIVPRSELLEDDSLPTLNKVLEAYAKSNGPKGKIGEIN
jgi:cell division septum initiation protein DivIVA